MKRIGLLITIGIMFISCSENTNKTAGINDHDVYEMRVYYTYEGRFNDIISRFENHTVQLFEKHGFNNVGYWTTLYRDSISYADKFIFQNDGKEALIYIVSFRDMDTRDESWNNFINDPEWIKVFEESTQEGPIVKEIEQVFLSPTIFSNLN